MRKCRHPITTVRHMAMCGIDMGIQIMCLDCGAATQFVRSFKAARRSWEAGRVDTNDTLRGIAECIRNSKRLTDAEMTERYPEACPTKGRGKGKR